MASSALNAVVAGASGASGSGMGRRSQEPERTWGRLPNVYRQAPSMQQLREDPRLPHFEALPPVEALALAGPASHRYVRQDDPLWSQLHEGVLTTGLVRQALGLYEKAAAKKLGIPNSRAGHSALLSAYRHLQHQPSSGSSANPDAATEAAAAAHNAAAVVAYNTTKQRALEAAPAGTAAAAAATAGKAEPPRRQDVMQDQPLSSVAASPAPAAAAVPSGEAAGMSKHARRRQRKRLEQAATAALRACAPAAAGPSVTWGVSEEQKLKKARALGSLGLMSICCSWGSAQEAAALLQVAAAFPRSELAEVGLCRLQQHLLPTAWGFAPGALPPMGASPDALIWHTLPSASRAAAVPAAAAGSASRAAASHGLQAADVQGQAMPPAAVGPWDIDALLERLQLAGTGGAASAAPHGATGGSSSSGDIAVCSSGGNNTVSNSDSSICGSCSSSSGGCSSSSGSGSAGAQYLVEVVEVKNTCPFGHSRRGGKLRTTEFAVADRGPRQEVPPEWVPQLQLHMLCAGTPSGLLVSRSATKGTRIFRMQRDDELLRLMLLVISRLWQQHVLPGRPPPADVYASWREHHDMMRRILEAARAAQLIATIEDAHRLPCGDSRWFLD